MSEQSIVLTSAGGVATLTLNRPDAGNCINIPMARSLMEASIVCDEDDDIKLVILGGAGKYFCTGGDVSVFAEAGDRIPSLLKELTAYLNPAISRLAHMNKPLVTAINGPAAGAGVSLALLGDIAIASNLAHFTLAYGAIGLSPDCGASWLLPRLVGLRRAQELALLNKRISAADAAAMGLITRTVRAENFDAEVESLASQLTSSATRAWGRTRNLFLSSFADSFEEHLELEARAIALSGRDSESREGIGALRAHRRPQFK